MRGKLTVMDNHRNLNRMVVRLSAVAILLFAGVSAFGACNGPHYRVGRRFRDDASGVAFQISIPLRDFAPERLVCLAAELKQKYPGRNVSAFMFSSHEAAVGYALSSESVPKFAKLEPMFHGFYVYGREKHEEYLIIDPDPLNHAEGSPFSTRIDLPVTGLPACKLAINGRCLLAIQHIKYYPSGEGQPAISGRVILTATILRSGAVSKVAVADAKATPPDRQSALASWAMRNLGTWRFEPAKRIDAVRITYEFEPAARVGYDTNAQIDILSVMKVWTGYAR